jgi:hypothetical protein
MKFTLEIELGNDAMQTFEDVRAAISKTLVHPVTNAFNEDVLSIGDTHTLRDVAGNRVGKWGVSG